MYNPRKKEINYEEVKKTDMDFGIKYLKKISDHNFDKSDFFN